MQFHGMQVGVSMVLSFMIVVDLPTISKGVASLSTSRLAPFYREVAPSVTVFANLFGKALQAQVGKCFQKPRRCCAALHQTQLWARECCTCPKACEAYFILNALQNCQSFLPKMEPDGPTLCMGEELEAASYCSSADLP